jgi:hypothetical protein
VTIFNILLPFGILCASLVYFVVIGYVFTQIGMFTKQNLATLMSDTQVFYVRAAANAFFQKKN